MSEDENLKDENPELVLENQICFSLYSATNAMIRTYRPLLEKLNLTYSQYLVMMVLWSSNGINVKNLGSKLHLDSGTLTPLLKRLETKGLVIRKRSEKDERVREMYLTQKGRELKLKAVEVPKAVFGKSDLPMEELLALKSYCDQLTNKLL